MKQTLLLLSIVFFVSCNQTANQGQNGHPTFTHQDTLNFTEWFKSQKPEIKNHLITDTKRLLALKPDLLQGGPVSAKNAVMQVNSYVGLITADEEPYVIRSFFVNAGVLRKYLDADKTRQIMSFKLCFAYDTLFAQGKTQDPITELVILGVDKNGDYVLSKETNPGFYDQIAGCPAVCPNSGESQYDDLILTQTTPGRIMFPKTRPKLIKTK